MKEINIVDLEGFDVTFTTEVFDSGDNTFPLRFTFYGGDREVVVIEIGNHKYKAALSVMERFLKLIIKTAEMENNK